MTVACFVAAAVTAVGPVGSGDAAVNVVETDAVDATSPSISADGRWIVFEGVVGERRSVFRHDRGAGATIELSTVPDSARSGDTIMPRMSADGCVVVAITEIPFDLFRDDDQDERWDVYRLVVPECGGQVNGWELVSTSESTDTALDAVFPVSAPTVSGSGALVAYTLQARSAPEGVSTIALVDLTVPLSETGRVVAAPGMPFESPNLAYLYRGARDPVLSENGRQLAFVSDATAADALPGWGTGPDEGGFATSQVYVWDRDAPDQQRAVRLVSGRDGVASASGAGDPDLSETGRFVAFTSSDRTLVPAQLPPCTQTCPTQVYRLDRDTDGNGIFDEAPRDPPLSIVSAVGAGKVDVGLPHAGNASSWAPALNADGSQVAFVTDATDLIATRRLGGGTSDDGDLLVAEIGIGALRRVLDQPGELGVPGAHGHPDLSRTGQVIAFDTAAATTLTGVSRASTAGTRNVVTAEVQPRLALAELDFGTTLLGFESTELFTTVRNAGPGSFEPAQVVSSTPNFRVTGGTCAKGILVAAGSSCSVHMTFNPSAPRGFSGTLSVSGLGPSAPVVTATVRGAAGDPTLEVEPGGVDVGSGVVGTHVGRIAVDVRNTGFLPTAIARITLGGANPDDFSVVTQSCTNRALNADATCAIEVAFVPRGAGFRSALLIVTTPIGQYTTAVLAGEARYEPYFEANVNAIAPAAEIGLGGHGFPPGSVLVLGFDDGSAPFALIQTTPDGTFLAGARIPARLRPGMRDLVMTGPEGAVATWPIEIVASTVMPVPRSPGFGLG